MNKPDIHRQERAFITLTKCLANRFILFNQATVFAVPISLFPWH